MDDEKLFPGDTLRAGGVGPYRRLQLFYRVQKDHSSPGSARHSNDGYFFLQLLLERISLLPHPYGKEHKDSPAGGIQLGRVRGNQLGRAYRHGHSRAGAYFDFLWIRPAGPCAGTHHGRGQGLAIITMKRRMG